MVLKPLPLLFSIREPTKAKANAPLSPCCGGTVMAHSTIALASVAAAYSGVAPHTCLLARSYHGGRHIPSNKYYTQQVAVVSNGAVRGICISRWRCCVDQSFLSMLKSRQQQTQSIWCIQHANAISTFAIAKPPIISITNTNTNTNTN